MFWMLMLEDGLSAYGLDEYEPGTTTHLLYHKYPSRMKSSSVLDDMTAVPPQSFGLPTGGVEPVPTRISGEIPPEIDTDMSASGEPNGAPPLADTA